MKRLLIAALAMVGLSAPARADLMSEMQDMLGTMSNYTAPGVYESRTRGVISGGSVSVRSRVKQTNLISFVPPSFKAGCGGIDLFLGSFGFINADEFSQLLRNVASNAAGYAFYVALDVTCSTCKQTIETLQQKIQQLNQYFGNSCQLAKGIVNDAKSAIEGKELTDTGLVNQTKGLVDGVFDAFGKIGSSDPVKTLSENDPSTEKKKFNGNLIWKALKENDVAKWFAYGDDKLLQVLMSVTGTIIVTTEKNSSGDYVRKKDFIDGNVSLSDLMHANGKLKYLRCSDGTSEDACLKLEVGAEISDFKGMATLVEDMLLGTNRNEVTVVACGSGIIAKLSCNAPLSAQEKNFVAAMNGAVGTMLIQLAKHNYATAQTAAFEGAPLVALEMVGRLTSDMIQVASSATAGLDNDYAQLLYERVTEVKRSTQTEWARISQEKGSVGEFLQKYYNYIGFSRRVRAGVMVR